MLLQREEDSDQDSQSQNGRQLVQDRVQTAPFKATFAVQRRLTIGVEAQQ